MLPCLSMFSPAPEDADNAAWTSPTDPYRCRPSFLALSYADRIVATMPLWTIHADGTFAAYRKVRTRFDQRARRKAEGSCSDDRKITINNEARHAVCIHPSWAGHEPGTAIMAAMVPAGAARGRVGRHGGRLGAGARLLAPREIFALMFLMLGPIKILVPSSP